VTACTPPTTPTGAPATPPGDLWRCDLCGALWRAHRTAWARARPWSFRALVELARREHLDRARANAGWGPKPDDRSTKET